MTLDIYKVQNPKEKEFLKQACFAVGDFGETLSATAQNMVETMLVPNKDRFPRGVGLAAPQVGIAQNFFVMMTPEAILKGTYETMALVNPSLIFKSSETDSELEGCLSIPGFVGRVIRHKEIKVEYSDVVGQRHELALTGFPARVFQHEFDHLQGILFLDRTKEISALKQ